MGWRNTILGQDENPCQHPNAGQYCPDCGLRMQVPRLGFGDIFGGSNAAWEEKPFRRTLFGLLLRPGAAIRTYLFHDRSYLTKPVTFLVLAIAFGLWVQHLMASTEGCAPDDGYCRMWDEDAWSLRMIQIGMFALVYRLFFRKAGLNLWEYGVGFAYIAAESLILGGVVRLILFAAPPLAGDVAAFVVYSTYTIVATTRLLQIRGRWRIAGAVLLGVLTLFVYLLLLSWLGEIWLDDQPVPTAEPAAAPAAAIAAPPG